MGLCLPKGQDKGQPSQPVPLPFCTLGASLPSCPGGAWLQGIDISPLPFQRSLISHQEPYSEPQSLGKWSCDEEEKKMREMQEDSFTKEFAFINDKSRMEVISKANISSLT